MTVQEVAEHWDLTARRVAVLCKGNRIPGVERDGHRRLILADAEKPAGKRVRSGAYGTAAPASLLSLPVDVFNFKKAGSNRLLLCGPDFADSGLYFLHAKKQYD